MIRKNSMAYGMIALGALALNGCSKSNSNSCTLTSYTTAAAPAEETAIGISNESTPNTQLGQTFMITSSTTGSTSSVASVSLYLSKVGSSFSTNAGANTITVQLQGNTAGTTGSSATPDSSLFSSSSVTVDALDIPANGPTLVKFAFPSAVSIDNNKSYWIVVSASYLNSVTSANYIAWNENTSGTTLYGEGLGYYYTYSSGPWTELGSEGYFQFIVASC